MHHLSYFVLSCFVFDGDSRFTGMDTNHRYLIFNLAPRRSENHEMLAEMLLNIGIMINKLLIQFHYSNRLVLVVAFENSGAASIV